VRQLFSNLGAAYLLQHHAGGEFENASSSLFGWDSTTMDIRDQVPISIRMSRARSKAYIRGQTLGGGQTRTFSDEQYRHPRVKKIPDIVENSNATKMYRKW